MDKTLQIAATIVLAIAIIISCTFLGTKMTDPATYSHTIEVLDQNRKTILGLTAASAAASAAVSVLPDDVCNSLSEKLSDFTTYFMIILCIIFLEKYLLTILGAAACYVLIPAGCSFLLVSIFFPSKMLKSMGIKLVIFGAALLLAIPTSVWVSDQINAVYSESIEITVQSATTVSEHLTGEVPDGDDENTTVIDEAKALLGDLSGSVARVVEQFKNLLNRFIEATAVMIVTTCLIPILVVVFFAWLVKTLFNVEISLPKSLPKAKKPKSLHNEDNKIAIAE